MSDSIFFKMLRPFFKIERLKGEPDNLQKRGTHNVWELGTQDTGLLQYIGELIFCIYWIT